MNEQHSSYRTTILPVPEWVPCPLWSVMIPTYNCAKYLRETLTSVLTQDPGSDIMQIEVVDDCSTQDDPAAVVEELGCGRVRFYRQPKNVGHIKNFQTCLERSQGKLIHLLHGDDCVRQGFYCKLQRAFEEKPEIGAAFCRHIMIDERGHWQYLSWLEQLESSILDNWLERIAVEQRVQTPSIVIRRDVYERLGSFDSRLSWSEDWEMWVRIAAHYPIWYEVEPLAVYRIHSNSSSGCYMRTGEDVRDVRRAIEIFQSYLPEATAGALTNQAREKWALEAIKYSAPKMLAIGDFKATTIQVQEALKCSRSWRIVRALAPLVMKAGKLWIKRTVSGAKVLPPTKHKLSRHHWKLTSHKVYHKLVSRVKCSE